MPKFYEDLKIFASYNDDLDSLQVDNFDTSITVNDSSICLDTSIVVNDAAVQLNDASAKAQLEVSVAVDYDSAIVEYTYDIEVHCDSYGDYEACDVECIDYPTAEIKLDESYDYQTVSRDDGFVNHNATSDNITSLIISSLNRSARMSINCDN